MKHTGIDNGYRLLAMAICKSAGKDLDYYFLTTTTFDNLCYLMEVDNDYVKETVIKIAEHEKKRRENLAKRKILNNKKGN